MAKEILHNLFFQFDVTFLNMKLSIINSCICSEQYSTNENWIEIAFVDDRNDLAKLYDDFYKSCSNVELNYTKPKWYCGNLIEESELKSITFYGVRDLILKIKDFIK